MITRTSFRLSFLAVLALFSFQMQNAGAVQNCASTGSDSGGGNWSISCTGQCPESAPCPEYTVTGLSSGWSDTNGSDAGGDYWTCICEGEGESACCHWVLYKGSSSSAHTPGTAGSCPTCPLSGTCKLNESKEQAICTMGGQPR